MALTYDVFKELASKGLENRYGPARGGAIAFLFFGKYGMLGLADVASVVAMAQKRADNDIGKELTEEMAVNLLLDVFSDLFILSMNRAGVTFFQTLENPLFFARILFSSEEIGDSELPADLRNWQQKPMERPFEEMYPGSEDPGGNPENNDNNQGDNGNGPDNEDNSGNGNNNGDNGSGTSHIEPPQKPEKYEREPRNYDRRDPFEDEEPTGNENSNIPDPVIGEDPDEGMTVTPIDPKDGSSLGSTTTDDKGPEVIKIEKELKEKEKKEKESKKDDPDDDPPSRIDKYDFR